jgi:hypothetical protein
MTKFDYRAISIEQPRIRLIRAVLVAMAIACGVPSVAYASLACEQRPCNSPESCDKVAEWVVEGTFTLNWNSIWLENAVLLRGDYPVPQGTTYLENASPTCYPVLPEGARATTAEHLVGKRVRAFGSNKRVAYVDRGVIFIEVVSEIR